MTTRRDFLRAGLVTAAAIIVPDEQFVRRFFPVGIDLRRHGAICLSDAQYATFVRATDTGGYLMLNVLTKHEAQYTMATGWTRVT